MAENKQNLQFLICNNCYGIGYVGNKNCPVCDRRGVISFWENNIYYWGKKIDKSALALNKLEKLLNNISKLILALIGLGGIISLVYGFYLLDFNVNSIFSLEYWNTPNVFLAYFFISLFFDLYFIYFYSLEADKKASVTEKIYRAEDDFSHLLPPPLDWAQLRSFKHKNQIDISLAFDAETKKIIEQAYELAFNLKANEVSAIHVLLSCLLHSQVSENIFLRLGVQLNDFVEKLSRLAAKYPQSDKEVFFGIEIQKILIKAYYLCYNNRNQVVDVLDVLAEAIQRDEKIQEILTDLSITNEQVTNVILWFRIRRKLSKQWSSYRASSRLKSKSGIDRAMTAVQTPFLNKFSEDLTMMAKRGQLDLSIDRDKEFAEIFRILEGATIKAVILVGEPGVGKTAIIEGLAQKMIGDDVPEFMQDKRLVSLSVSRLVAGVSLSEAQERLLICFNEIAHAGNIVLFIDNLQDMISISEAGLSEVIVEALSKNLFTLIATTTQLSYKKSIESSSVANIIKKVEISEPDINGAIQILEGKAIFMESKNNVYLSYEAIESAVKLSDHYIHEQFLPYKALTILEEVVIWARQTKGPNCLVTGDDVATLLSEKIGMPVTKISESESEKLLNLEDIIHQRMIDQEEAVSAVANSLRRGRAELREKNRPISNLLFLGPTGVGKTELAKTIAEVYFGSEDNMIRLDMSEYQAADSVNRLIGVPAGYTESNKGGILTEAVRRKPYSIVLLDELEKAHPDILNLFLQVLDDGRLTDANGRTIDFTNTIVIATSNATTSFIQDKINEGLSIEEIKKQLMETELKKSFRPEFINRFDNIILFKSLGYEEVLKITELMLLKVARSMEEKGINFQATEEAVKEVAQIGFDPQYGARPLRRAIQDHVDNALAKFLLTGKIGRRDVVILDKGGEIRVEKAEQL
ncbi:MAG: AAA family ATPase [Candidatus Parcubacteria bacterium]|nr:AAA family ATPase [Candidatus Parcubacteria bacterium]